MIRIRVVSLCTQNLAIDKGERIILNKLSRGKDTVLLTQNMTQSACQSTVAISRHQVSNIGSGVVGYILVKNIFP